MPKLGCIAEITNNFSWLIQTYGLFLRSETQKNNQRSLFTENTCRYFVNTVHSL